MSDLLKYKGFSAKFDFLSDGEAFSGRVYGVEDDVKFEGTSARELKKSMKDAVEAYVEKCRKKGRDARKTYSGKLLFRLSPELHAGIADAAAGSGLSINEWGRDALESAVRADSLREAKRRAARSRKKR